MTKSDLINQVHGNLGGSWTKKNTGEAVQAVFDNISKALQGNGRFAYPDVGTWKVKARAARTGRNPRTGASIQIPASKNVSFKPAPNLKGSL